MFMSSRRPFLSYDDCLWDSSFERGAPKEEDPRDKYIPKMVSGGGFMVAKMDPPPMPKRQEVQVRPLFWLQGHLPWLWGSPGSTAYPSSPCWWCDLTLTEREYHGRQECRGQHTVINGAGAGLVVHWRTHVEEKGRPVSLSDSVYVKLWPGQHSDQTWMCLMSCLYKVELQAGLNR